MEENRKFSQFVNQYELPKTLRFELKPIGDTSQMLINDNIFQKDKLISEKYEKTKVYIDKLHREFVEESLHNFEFTNLEYYKIALNKVKKINNSTNKKERTLLLDKLAGEEKILRESLIGGFNATAEAWSIKYPQLKYNKNKPLDILFHSMVFSFLLKPRYGGDPETLIDAKLIDKDGKETTGKCSIFDDWKGFSGYFTKFFATRRNFYKSDGTSTAIATRIVDQNLKRFYYNLQTIQKIKEKINFTQIEKDYQINITDFFTLKFYNHCLLQDGIDVYNKILGGQTLENGEKLQGVNELINEYRQTHPAEKIPFLRSLDKQIMSEKDMFIDEIVDDHEFEKHLKTFYNNANEKIKITKSLFEDFVYHNEKYDLSKIYISKKAWETISRKWTNDTNRFAESLFAVINTKEIRNEYSILKSKTDSAIKKDKDNNYSFPNFIKLQHIKTCLLNINTPDFWKFHYYEHLKTTDIWQQFLEIFYLEFSSLFGEKPSNIQLQSSVKAGHNSYRLDIESLLDNFHIDQQSKSIIKNYADNILKIYQMSQYFAIEKNRNWLDNYELDDFYTNPKNGYRNFYKDAYKQIVQGYNKLRNYLTKKPWEDTQKWKLNFGNSTLANGWDKNKERENSTIILRQNGKYFLGVMKKGHNKIFDDINISNFKNGIEDGKYQKMVYKFLPPAAKMFPKFSTQLKAVRLHFKVNDKPYVINTSSFNAPLTVSRRIFDLNNISYDKKNINQTTTSKTGGLKQFQKEYRKISGDYTVYKSALNDWIDFCKDILSKYKSTSIYDFRSLKKTEEYSSLDKFYKDVADKTYNISWQDISSRYIEEKNKLGELYLFQIKNKDWNEGSTGRKNLHTLYFENIFSEINNKLNFVLKLDGSAELFYRPKIAVEKLGFKKDKQGKRVVDHKRYSENKIFFHVPISLNRGKGKIKTLNKEINNFLANNKGINIIGIDRGEKHLAYYSIIDQEGKVLESDTLNVISGINYYEKLSKRAKEREGQRQDWQVVKDIKNLKKGYISQVVRKLADLVIKYNAIIVFEDLNMRFKQIRGGIEKSAYQQLEKALIEKLTFLVNKTEMDPQKAGHLLKAYQLAAPIEAFKDMGKQTGIIFYTTASYTSKIDPITGWRPNLYLKYRNAVATKTTISKFSNIKYKNNHFEFTYDLKNFINKIKNPPINTTWTLATCVERYRWSRKLNNNKGGYHHYANLTDDFKSLFDEVNIDISGDIKGQVDHLESDKNVAFFKRFIYLWQLLCQIRNTNEDETGHENDFIYSPVYPYFDSRKDNGPDLPKNGDDNGAFNIARKGIIMLNKISKFARENDSDKNIGWGDLYVSSTDWDDFVYNAHIS